MACPAYAVLRGARLSSLAAALSLALGSLSPAAADGSRFNLVGDTSTDVFPVRNPAQVRKLYAQAINQFQSLPVSHPRKRAATTVQIASTQDSGPGTLRDALDNAVDGDVIDLTHLRGTLTLTSSLVPAAKVSINGPGRDFLRIDGNHLDRVLASDHSLQVSKVTLSNGATANSGGCLFVRGKLTLSDSRLSDCSVDGTAAGSAYGGGAFVLGSLSVQSSALENNSVAAPYPSGGDLKKPYHAAGGALFVLGSSDYRGTTIFDSQFTGNSATGGRLAGGGAIDSSCYCTSQTGPADVALYGSTVSGNSVDATGIAPYYSQTYHNTSYPGFTFGAGVAVSGGNVSVVGSHIDNNRANASGRAFGTGLSVSYVGYYDSTTYGYSTIGGSITMSASTIAGNSATAIYGGPLGTGLMAGGDIWIAESVLSNNQALTLCPGNCLSAGGAVSSGYYTRKLSILNSTLSGNSITATQMGTAIGGAIVTQRHEKVGTVVTMIGSTVSGNIVTGPIGGAYGAGICQGFSTAPETLSIYNSTVAFNSADGFGGGIVLNGRGPLNLASTVVADNSSAQYLVASDIAATTATFVIGGDYSLVRTDPSAYGVTFTGMHNIVGSDPLLKPLAYNGGATPTHALDPASPAIDQGSNPLSLDFDQRGDSYSRVVGARADIGALELDTNHIFAGVFE